MSVDPLEVFTEAERTDLADWIAEWLKDGHSGFEIAEAFGTWVAMSQEGAEPSVEEIHSDIRGAIKRIREMAVKAGMPPEEISGEFWTNLSGMCVILAPGGVSRLLRILDGEEAVGDHETITGIVRDAHDRAMEKWADSEYGPNLIERLPIKTAETIALNQLKRAVLEARGAGMKDAAIEDFVASIER